MLCLLAICTRVLSLHMPSSLLSVNQQCQLLGVNRSGLYDKPRTNNTKQAIKNHITQVFEQIPIYGEKKVHQQLISALARKVFFQFCRFCGSMLCLLAICTRVLSFCNNSSTNFVLNVEVYLVQKNWLNHKSKMSV
jgi:hypothetical protein